MQGGDKRLFGPVQLVVGVKHHDDVVDDVDQPERPDDYGDGHDELQDAWKETHGQIRHQHRGIHALHVVDHDGDEEIGEANTHGGPQRLVGILDGLALDGLGADDGAEDGGCEAHGQQAHDEHHDHQAHQRQQGVVRKAEEFVSKG